MNMYHWISNENTVRVKAHLKMVTLVSRMISTDNFSQEDKLRTSNRTDHNMRYNSL